MYLHFQVGILNCSWYSVGAYLLVKLFYSTVKEHCFVCQLSFILFCHMCVQLPDWATLIWQPSQQEVATDKPSNKILTPHKMLLHQSVILSHNSIFHFESEQISIAENIWFCFPYFPSTWTTLVEKDDIKTKRKTNLPYLRPKSIPHELQHLKHKAYHNSMLRPESSHYKTQHD